MGFLSGIGAWFVETVLSWLLRKLTAFFSFEWAHFSKKSADEKAVDAAVKEDIDAKTKEERDKAADDISHTGF